MTLALLSAEGGTVRWLLGGALLTVGAAVACANAWIAATARRRQRRTGRHVSLIPVIGGAALLAAFLVLPLPTLRRLAWIAPWLDAGTLLIPVSAIVPGWQRWRGGRPRP